MARVARAVPACLVLGACSPDTAFVRVPEEIAVVAWLRISSVGELLEASPLMPVPDAEVFATEGDVVFAGWGPELAAIAGATPLVAPDECAPRLQAPVWVQSTRPGAEPVVPPLGAAWAAEACPSDSLECEPCEPSCSGTLGVFATFIEHTHPLRGIVRVAADRLLVSGPPDEIREVHVDPELGLELGVATTMQIATTPTIANGLAFDGTWAYAPGNRQVIAVKPDGTVREISTGVGPLRVAAELGGRAFAYEFGGAAFELVQGSSVAAPRPELPDEIYDMAIFGGAVFSLTPEGVHIHGEGAPELIPLPGGFPFPAGGGLNDGARIGVIRGDPVIGMERSDVYRYNRASRAWTELGWPTDGRAQPRAFVDFAGGVLIGGRSPSDSGMLMLAYAGSRCSIVGLSPLTGIAFRPGDSRAYGVTTGDDARLIEVPLP